MNPHICAGCDVSIIIPLYNAARWLDDAFCSIVQQDFTGTMEVSVYDDDSTDGSVDKVEEWKTKLAERGIRLQFSCARSSVKGRSGPGYSRNRAISQSCGAYLCLLDADDVMHPSRVRLQYEVASVNPTAIVGCKFIRDPVDSTQRYTRWANELTASQLYLQIYTSHGPTLIQPTWFFRRSVWNQSGPFDESVTSVPEDLIFFYKHLDCGGHLIRVDDELLTYRYHVDSATFSIEESAIWNMRLTRIQREVLSKFESFTIWNAGKQGRRFYRSLNDENRAKVVAFCDVDRKKIERGVYIYEESTRVPKPSIPVVHYSHARPPFIVCVKLDLTKGIFEQNLSSLNLCEGVDYFHFS